jgi:hypothetical protein
VIHFDLPDHTRSKLQPWLMVNKHWGERSHNVMEPVDDVKLKNMLPDHCRNKLKVTAFSLFANTSVAPSNSDRRTLKSMTLPRSILGHCAERQSQRCKGGLFDMILTALFTTSLRYTLRGT